MMMTKNVAAALLLAALPCTVPCSAGATSFLVSEADAGRLSVISRDGTFVTTFLDGLSHPTGVAASDSARLVVWGDSLDGVVRKVGYDGAGFSPIANGQDSVVGVATDGTEAFWTTPNLTSLFKVSLAGGVPTLLDLGGTPTAVAVDSTKVWWIRSDLHSIRSVAKAGGSVGTLASGTDPAGVASDGSRVYWGDSGSISRTPARGGPIDTVATGVGTTSAMAWDATSSTLYWVDAGAGTLESTASGTNTVVARGLSNPLGVALVDDPAATVAADACVARKLGALGKQMAGIFSCAAKVAKAGDTNLLAPCAQKVDEKAAAAFDKAGSCAGDLTACTAALNPCGSWVLGYLPDGTILPGASACEAARLKAVGKKISALLKCAATAAKKGAPIDLDGCVAKANAKFDAAYDKVSGCSGDGQLDLVSSTVNQHCASLPLTLDFQSQVTAICQ